MTSRSSNWRIGVDIGGTFIDFCALETGTNRLESLKVLTTPDDPGRELMQGLALLQERHGVAPEAVAGFVHGTTVGINTIIQRKGARLALVTNAGFEDVIELARLRMPEVYSLFCSRPEQLIPRDLVFGVRGRVMADGSEAEALDEAALAAIADTARARGAVGIVVAFLHAYRNPAQEQAAKACLQRLAPDLFAFASAEIWPVIREYERTTTAILNAYVHPRVAGYLGSLEATLRDRGVPARPMLTKSNGGIMDVAAGKTACISMLLSGTASGVMGAAYLAEQAGQSNLLTLDIGGTSADLALIIDGAPQFGTGEIIGDFPLYVPSVSVTSIGAGGGSIASVDGFGVLRVGPESAGSTPGPACYGRGGTRATITDAVAVCGFLGHAPLAYDALRMDRGRAEAAVGAVAAALGRGLRETGEAILQVAVSEMFVEVNKLVARAGVDLRDFTLMPFGGAGPMLGCLLARELGIGRVMVPRRPGVVCALGGLIADVKSDFIRTVFARADAAVMPVLKAAHADLRREAETWLRDEQGFAGPAVATVSADMRYHGQSFEIEVPLDEAWLSGGDLPALRAAFHRQHLALYDFDDAGAEIQVVNLRLVIAGATARPVMVPEPRTEGPAEPEREVAVWLDGAERRVPLYWRAALRHGQTLAGPAVVVQEDTTTCIPGGFAGHVDAHLNLHLVREN
ncbi:hydantoinase/oxoprolinase family protein [Methylobacterium oryzihabitans]|uniref:Hydantoinase/oxoprolinase family protein n=1 Tax=Methylobacterium oryzihabitans TaxID=2499852 RepID=A0A3S2V9J5_9HYPH|nr:hydantoinase/oxoprolinase family protein [Methylobacterium oryzihabitans]RVU19095.1 hydantoinase/oxoprolinase family protein [Methylobacterium oryzihabitans]